MNQEASLTFYDPSNSNQKRVYSLKEKTLIGRQTDCDLVVDENQFPSVSRHHAEIISIVEENHTVWQITEVKEVRNGTFINGNRLKGSQNLKPGDRIVLSKDGPEFIFDCKSIPMAVGALDPNIPANPTPVANTPVAITQKPQMSPTLRPGQSNPPGAGVTKNLWNLATEENITTLEGHKDQIKAVVFSADRKLLASASTDKTANIWDLNSEKLIKTISGHKLAVNAVTFSLDSKTLATGSADKTIKCWDFNSGEEIQQLTGHTMGVNCVTYSPNGKLLASGSADKTVRIWDLQKGDAQVLEGHKMGINTVAFSHDGKILASGSADKNVNLWQVETGKILLTLPSFSSPINAIAFSPDNKILAIAGNDKIIRLWDWQALQEVRSIFGYSWQVGTMGISSDGQKLASGCQDHTVKVWGL